MTPDAHKQMLRDLREIGVSEYTSGEGWTVKFHAQTRAPADSTPELPPRKLFESADAGTCHCGHDMTAHAPDGLCLVCTATAECMKGEVKPATP